MQTRKMSEATTVKVRSRRESWSSKFLTWKEFVTVTTSLLVLVGSIFAYFFSMHIAQPHHGAATSEDVNRIHDRLDRMETRQQEIYRRLDTKIDKLLQKE